MKINEKEIEREENEVAYAENTQKTKCGISKVDKKNKTRERKQEWLEESRSGKDGRNGNM